MKIAEADVCTEHAASYLRQLCRHWAHRFKVELTDAESRIELPATLCILTAATSVLRVRLEMDDAADADRMEQVVAEHLQRFGFKEQLVFPWRRSSVLARIANPVGLAANGD